MIRIFNKTVLQYVLVFLTLFSIGIGVRLFLTSSESSAFGVASNGALYQIGCYQSNLLDKGLNVYNTAEIPIEYVDPAYIAYNIDKSPLQTILVIAIRSVYRFLTNDISCNYIVVANIILDALIAPILGCFLFYARKNWWLTLTVPMVWQVISIAPITMNVLMGGGGLNSFLSISILLFAFGCYIYEKKVSTLSRTWKIILEIALVITSSLLATYYPLLILILPIVLLWLHSKSVVRLPILIIISIVSLSIGLTPFFPHGLQGINFLLHDIIRGATENSIFSVLPWFVSTIGNSTINTYMVLLAMGYTGIIYLVLKKRASLFNLVLLCAALVLFFQANSDFATVWTGLLLGGLYLSIHKPMFGIGIGVLQLLLSFIFIQPPSYALPSSFIWANHLYPTFMHHVGGVFVLLVGLGLACGIYAVVKNTKLKIALLCIIIFIASLGVRFYIFNETATQFGSQLASNTDLKIYEYQSSLVAQGISVYDTTDSPEARDIFLDRYHLGEPPVSLLLLGGIGYISQNNWLNSNYDATPLMEICILIDALIAPLLFLIFVYFTKFHRWTSAMLAMLLYGANMAPIIINVLNINIKPIYTFCIILMIALCLWFEKKYETFSGNEKIKWSLILATIICGLGVYKQLTFVVIPFFILWLFKKGMSWKQLILVVVVNIIVFILGYLPFFPDSLLSFSGRSIRTNIEPIHASIFQWIPWFQTQIYGYTISVHTVLAYLGLIILAVLVYFKKINLTAAAVWSMLMVVYFTTEGSLDRDLVVLTPLLMYIIIISHKKMYGLIIVNFILAAVLVIPPSYALPTLLYLYTYIAGFAETYLESNYEKMHGLYALSALFAIMCALVSSISTEQFKLKMNNYRKNK